MQVNKVVVWEAFDAADPMTQAAGQLYEQTLAPEERIPWYWIEKSVEGRTRSKPGKADGWTKHLLLAAPEDRADDPTGLAGYVYGALIPNYGGYLCYIGVANWARRLGVGTRLFDQFYRQMSVDAGELGSQLPFVIWESHRPAPGAPAAEWDLWAARTKLFDRAGGMWVEGVDFWSPNFASDDETGDPVPLQLFIKPMAESAGEFDADRLKAVVAGLHREVYRNEAGSDLYDRTLPAGCNPRLVPAKLAGLPVKAAK
ncbi:unnamed protein product [Gemmataceae bacterium]|nr:unnamed protein product [Gemmataceae bacterium]VTT98130.1 unnamed protein product [Gemmataceae bacterium]